MPVYDVKMVTDSMSVKYEDIDCVEDRTNIYNDILRRETKCILHISKKKTHMHFLIIRHIYINTSD